MALLNQDKVRGLFGYDPLTGILRWKIQPRANVKMGREAGWVMDGWKFVMIEQKTYPVSCVIWLWMTGKYPIGQIDHKDRCRSNNKWANLREVPQDINKQNKGLQCNNKSGVRGTYWNKAIKKWHTQISVKGKRKHLGFFNSLVEASAARKEAERLLYSLPEEVEA